MGDFAGDMRRKLEARRAELAAALAATLDPPARPAPSSRPAPSRAPELRPLRVEALLDPPKNDSRNVPFVRAIRAERRRPAKGEPTATNLYALDALLREGGGVIPNRLPSIHVPHLKRCLNAGLLEPYGDADKSWVLSPKGWEALAAWEQRKLAPRPPPPRAPPLARAAAPSVRPVAPLSSSPLRRGSAAGIDLSSSGPIGSYQNVTRTSMKGGYRETWSFSTDDGHLFAYEREVLSGRGKAAKFIPLAIVNEEDFPPVPASVDAFLRGGVVDPEDRTVWVVVPHRRVQGRDSAEGWVVRQAELDRGATTPRLAGAYVGAPIEGKPYKQWADAATRADALNDANKQAYRGKTPISRQNAAIRIAEKMRDAGWTVAVNPDVHHPDWTIHIRAERPGWKGSVGVDESGRVTFDGVFGWDQRARWEVEKPIARALAGVAPDPALNPPAVRATTITIADAFMAIGEAIHEAKRRGSPELAPGGVLAGGHLSIGDSPPGMDPFFRGRRRIDIIYHPEKPDEVLWRDWEARNDAKPRALGAVILYLDGRLELEDFTSAAAQTFVQRLVTTALDGRAIVPEKKP